jgi:hypothetical protein
MALAATLSEDASPVRMAACAESVGAHLAELRRQGAILRQRARLSANPRNSATTHFGRGETSIPNMFDLTETPGWPDCRWTAILLGQPALCRGVGPRLKVDKSGPTDDPPGRVFPVEELLALQTKLAPVTGRYYATTRCRRQLRRPRRAAMVAMPLLVLSLMRADFRRRRSPRRFPIPQDRTGISQVLSERRSSSRCRS